MSKVTHKFDYPHPLIKNLNEIKNYTEQNIDQFIKQKPCLYQTNYVFSSSIKNYISPKLLRISNTKVVPDQPFGILMQPFNQKQEVEKMQIIQNDEKLISQIKCKNCQAFFNSQDQSLSVNQIQCKICKSIQQINIQTKCYLQNIPNCCDFILQKQESVEQIRNIQKNICFVIQASEYNFNYKIHQIIESCLNSLKLVSCQYKEEIISQTTVHTQNGSQKKIDEQQINQQHNSCEAKVHYNIGFILFNDRNVFIINQQTQDLLNFSSQFFSSHQPSASETLNQNIILPFNQMFVPLQQVSSYTFQIIKEILYESYLKNRSCLDFTTDFIAKFVDNYIFQNKKQQNSSQNQIKNNLNQNCKQKRQIQYKFFINSTKFNEQTEIRSKSVNQSEKNNLFSNLTNSLSKKVPSIATNQKQTSKNSSVNSQQAKLKLNPNFQFYYLPKNQFQNSSYQVNQKEVIKKFNSNLAKMYLPKKVTTSAQDNFNTIYYDLYQNLSTIQRYYQVKMTIVTSPNVQILSVGNNCLGYSDFCENKQFRQKPTRFNIGEQSNSNRFNFYEMTLKTLQSNSTLPIDLKILPVNKNGKQGKEKNKLNNESKNWICIKLEYKKQYYDNNQNSIKLIPHQRVFQLQVTSLNRPINFHHHIYSSLSTYVDDQILFYFHLRSVLSDCYNTQTNHTIIKKLHQKMLDISQNFKNQYGQIDFHKQYSRIFLYAFMMQSQPMVNSTNQNFFYQRHLWLKSSFESLSKIIYPRIYELVRDRENSNRISLLKNIKSTPKNFRTTGINLVDDGKFLYLIIGEDNEAVELKRIFGTCYIDQIRQLTELPQIQSNQKQRQLIELARSFHESKYLPLKIIELFSPQFEQNIAYKLYIKDNHYSYMRVLWDMKPISKKMR